MPLINSAQGDRYACRTTGCQRVALPLALVDEVVTRNMIKLLSAPNALDQLSSGDPVTAVALRAEIAGMNRKLELIADDYADDKVTAAQRDRMTQRIRQRIAIAQGALVGTRPAAVPEFVAGDGARQRWLALPLEHRRALIRALVTVTLMALGRSAGRTATVADWLLIEPRIVAE